MDNGKWIMPFAPECFLAFQTRATFWAIFEKFPLVPPLHYFWKCGFLVTLPKMPLLGYSGTFGAAFCIIIFSSLCILRAYQLEDNAICARVPLRLSNDGYFLGDFWKMFLGPHFSLFSENAGFGWPFKNCHNVAFRALLDLCFAPQFSPVFAL